MSSKIIVVLLLASTFVCLGLNVGLSVYYMKAMPDSPQLSMQRTYPLNIHGSIVYLTASEDMLLKWLFIATFAFGISAGIVNFIKKPFEGK